MSIAPSPSMKIVAIEEHFATQDVFDAWKALDAGHADPATLELIGSEKGSRLLHFGVDRMAAMDEAGVDVQVLSLTTPGLQNLTAQKAVALAQTTNDLLTFVVRARPDRFQGFATIPTPHPKAAAKELERAVVELGFQGAMVFGRTGDANFDHKDYWPTFEAASALRAPLYIHPQTPPKSVIDAHYSGLGKDLESLLSRPGLGWHYEAGLQIVRMALAGIFERFPDLQSITGHMGEVVLFYLDRLDMMTAATKLPKKVSEYVREHLYVTPSGLFSQRYLQWSMEVLGPDRLMMSTDYPFIPVESGGARAFLESSPLQAEDRAKIASGNWDRLCRDIRR